jgi:hypothetical protein
MLLEWVVERRKLAREFKHGAMRLKGASSVLRASFAGLGLHTRSAEGGTIKHALSMRRPIEGTDHRRLAHAIGLEVFQSFAWGTASLPGALLSWWAVKLMGKDEMVAKIRGKVSTAAQFAGDLVRFNSQRLKSYLRKGVFGGDLRDVVATLERLCEQSGRDAGMLAKQINDLAEIRQMAIEHDRIRRELAHLAVNDANLTARIDGKRDGFRVIAHKDGEQVMLYQQARQ